MGSFTESMKQSAANAGIDIEKLKVNSKGVARISLGNKDLVMWYEEEENLPIRCALSAPGKLPAEKDTKCGGSPFQVLNKMKADILSADPVVPPTDAEKKKEKKSLREAVSKSMAPKE